MSNPNILLIYTGGTIGSFIDHSSQSLRPVNFKKLTAFIPELKRLAIQLDVEAFPKPLDSSNMHPGDWVALVEIIQENYDKYDGFVILHGTDTMSHTASALSFMIEGLNKPVILTGSQLPIGVIRTDGKENLVTAIEIAAMKDKKGHPLVPEVCIYFEFKLYRGNRSLKYSSEHFHAYQSPNYPLLGEAGVNINLEKEMIQPYKKGTPEFYKQLDNNLIVIKLFPGIGPQIFEPIAEIKDLRAIIVETYGFGNGPLDSWFGAWIKKITAKGILLINITQCLEGRVIQGKYETSRQFLEGGAVSGHDLTMEAAVTKLMHLMGRYPDNARVKKYFSVPLRGEMLLVE